MILIITVIRVTVTIAVIIFRHVLGWFSASECGEKVVQFARVTSSSIYTLQP